MKKFFSIFFGAILANSFIAQIQSKENLFSHNLSLTNQEIVDDNIDVFWYKLFLNVDYASKKFSSEIEIGFRSIVPNSNGFFLNCSKDLLIDSIYLNDKKRTFLKSDDFLYVNYGELRDLNSVQYVKIYYRKEQFADQKGFYFYERENVKSFYTFSQPYDAKHWFPCKNSPDDKADSSEVIIKADKDFKIVSNGSLVRIDTSETGKAIYRWKNSYPIANYLISIAAANYVIIEESYKNIRGVEFKIEHYLFPSSANDWYVLKNIGKTKEAIRIFEELFGEYPFSREKYGHAQAFFRGAMEHQTISTMGIFDEYVIVHELAHQWFGNKVTCKNWHNIWLNEGFATYSEILYQERAYGKNNALELIKTYSDYAKMARGSIYIEDISNFNSIFNFYKTYAKGAIVLHMLRNEIGDSAFFKTLKDYLSDDNLAYSCATIEQFQAKAEQNANRSLKYFFDQWIYGENYPILSITRKIKKISNEFYEVSLSFLQRKNNLPEYFIFPLEIIFSDGINSEKKKFFIDSSHKQFTFNLPFLPAQMSVDPENKLLIDYYLDDDYVKSQSNLKIDLFPIPAKNKINLNVYLFDFESLSLLLNVYNAYGKEIFKLNKMLMPGENLIEIGLENFSSGIYFIMCSSKNYNRSLKFCVIK